MKKNNTVEEINISINNLLEEWNISREHNDKIVTHVIGLQLKKIRLVNKMTQTRVLKQSMLLSTNSKIRKRPESV